MESFHLKPILVFLAFSAAKQVSLVINAYGKWMNSKVFTVKIVLFRPHNYRSIHFQNK